MQNLIAEIIDRTKDATTLPTETGIRGLVTIKGDVPQQQLAALYKPTIAFCVQGKKVLAVGERQINVIGPSYFVVPMHMPVRATVSRGPNGESYLSLGLALNHDLLHTLLRDLPAQLIQTSPRVLDACEAGVEFVEPWLRMLRLMKSLADIPALAPAYEREILYRVLVGPQGWYLRQLALTESTVSKIAGTVQWLRSHFMEPIVINEMARRAGMATTTFHRQFKFATGLSPIQFQKQLRLLEARNLIAFEGYAAANAAFEVGYQSPSQFNREYSRFFGAPPARDTSELRRIERGRSDSREKSLVV
jgi:AraC-like DNA-binding protein